MKSFKKDMVQFWVWMRNGTAFCTTWFLILILLYSWTVKQQTISVGCLSKMLLLIIGGVFLFTVAFTRILLKKWNFTKRLTCFMLAISVYECAGFYWLGIFQGKGSLLQWIVFCGIVCGLYLCCIGMYQQYSKKQGAIYTQALQEYQNRKRQAVK